MLQGNEATSLQVWTREGRGWEDVEVLVRRATGDRSVKGPQPVPKTIRLSAKALITLTKLIRESPDRETGGVLLGEHVDEKILVHFASGPGNRSKRMRNGIVLDVEYAQGCIDTASAMSGRRIRFLGEWHSHPTPPYTPSGKDVGALKRLASSPTANIDVPVIVIAGLDEEDNLNGKAYVWSAGITEIAVASQPFTPPGAVLATL